MTTHSVPAELTAACTDIRAAGPADRIAGGPASYVAAPASTDEASALLRAAARLGLTVVPRGSGRRQHWGNPPATCDLVVDTGRLDQVLEHAVGDLVVRVQAGVRLAQLATMLGAAGQRLALDPPEIEATVGGVLATNAAGPLRYRYGAPRDLLIGITVVRADGTVAKSGGKVVKNVAGYDLGKLFAGSYGTLGLITEATFRLHPLPQRSSWLSLDCPDPESAADAVRLMADSPLAPAAIELSWPAAEAPLAVSVLIEGDEKSVSGRADRMSELLERGLATWLPNKTKLFGSQPSHPTLAGEAADQTNPGDSSSHGELAHAGAAVRPVRLARPLAGDRELPGKDDTLLRLAFWGGQLARVLSTVRSVAAANGVDPAISGSAGAGILEVGLTAESDAAAVARFVGELRNELDGLSDGVVPRTASAVVLCAPPGVRDAVDVWGPVPSLRLMQAVKDQFDPEHRMAPGRLAGGI